MATRQCNWVFSFCGAHLCRHMAVDPLNKRRVLNMAMMVNECFRTLDLDGSL